MQFQCKACGSSFSAMEWNIATRKHTPENRDFIPIQTIFDSPDTPNIKEFKWFCPNCSIDKPDVGVKLDEF
jgi:rubredoxin